MITVSPEARAAFEAFRAAKADIEDRFAAEQAAAKAPKAEAAVKPYYADQNAALSTLTETGAKLQEAFTDARSSYRASDLRKSDEPEQDPFAPREERGTDRLRPNDRERDDPFAPAKNSTAIEPGFGAYARAGRPEERPGGAFSSQA